MHVPNYIKIHNNKKNMVSNIEKLENFILSVLNRNILLLVVLSFIKVLVVIFSTLYTGGRCSKESDNFYELRNWIIAFTVTQIPYWAIYCYVLCIPKIPYKDWPCIRFKRLCMFYTILNEIVSFILSIYGIFLIFLISNIKDFSKCYQVTYHRDSEYEEYADGPIYEVNMVLTTIFSNIVFYVLLAILEFCTFKYGFKGLRYYTMVTMSPPGVENMSTTSTATTTTQQTIKITNGQRVFLDTKCPLCLGDYYETPNMPAITLVCGHIFHEECSKELIRTSNCPVCRKKVTEEINVEGNVEGNVEDNVVIV